MCTETHLISNLILDKLQVAFLYKLNFIIMQAELKLHFAGICAMLLRVALSCRQLAQFQIRNSSLFQLVVEIFGLVILFVTYTKIIFFLPLPATSVTENINTYSLYHHLLNILRTGGRNIQHHLFAFLYKS